MATDGLPPLMALATLDDGHAEWYFNEYATLQRLVEDILPSDVSQRKATALVRDCCPDLDFTSRDVRTCIAATRVKEPVLSTEPVMLPGIDAKAFADKFLIRHTTLAGFGAFANRDIKRGERILAEEPLIECTIPKSGDCDLTAIIGTLSEGKQEAYYALSQAPLYGETKTNVGIWHSNAYPQASPLAMAFDLQNGVGRDKEGACFAVACRFNHSCVPNVHCAWNGRLKRQTIHALRDIAKGEELVVNYLAELAMPTEARRRRLREGFGFECMCAACTLVADAQQASDRRRARIRELAVMVRRTRERHTRMARCQRRRTRSAPRACLITCAALPHMRTRPSPR